MKKIQFGAELVLKNENSNASYVLNYFLVETPVGFGYSKLKNYGIEIKKTDKIPGMKDISETKLIQGIFFDPEEAISFLAKIKKEHITPSKLSEKLEEFIFDKIAKQRKQSQTLTAI